MARTIQEIKADIAEAYIANPFIASKYELEAGKTFDEQFSKVSVEGILFYVVASAIWTVEQLFDILRKEITGLLAELKPHTLRWYVNKAKAFRFGQALIPETDKYNNTGLTDEQIAAMQVVKHAAAVEGGSSVYYLRIKTAGESGGELCPLSNSQLTAIQAYFKEIKDAGVNMRVTTGPPDDLIGKIRVYYNPMVLASDGVLLSGGISPVKEAINGYLKALPFNGQFTIMGLTDKIQQAEGVQVVQVIELLSRYGTANYEYIEDIVTPDAGYMRVASYEASAGKYLQIEYKPYE